MQGEAKRCPRCGTSCAPGAVECHGCGVILAKVAQKAPGEQDEDLRWLVQGHPRLFMEQHARHWWEILTGVEQANEYTLSDTNGRPVAFVSEIDTSFLRLLARLFLGARRPVDVIVANLRKDVVLQFSRKFTFFFSEIRVVTGRGEALGMIQRRFSVLYRHYDLIDPRGRVFASVRSPIWRLWTFPILDAAGRERGVITKKWSNLLQEYFTDADNFVIDFGGDGWSAAERALILAAAILIDFDFFENNHQR